MADITAPLKEFFSETILPLLLVWTISFAILEKVKFFGDNKKQLNAIISLIIGLIFSFSVFPKVVVGNLILFLTVALIALFVIMLLWGFVFGDESQGFKPESWMKWSLAVLSAIAFIWAVLWATGWSKNASGFVSINLSNPIFMNILFIVIVAVILALLMSSPSNKKPKEGSK